MTILFPGVAESVGAPSTSVKNAAVAAQAPVAATRTYITGSQLAVPNGGLSVGSKFKFKLAIAKTAAGSATSTFDVAIGVNGTVADAAAVSFVKPAGTAAADEAVVTVEGTVTAISKTAGGIVAEFVLAHNLEVTGHALTPNVVLSSIVTNADTSLADALFIGLCVTTGAADAITIHYAEAELSALTTGASG